MAVVVVPDPKVEKQVFVKAKQILSSLTDFEPQLWQLPAFT
jgi:pseudouridine-5'-monophosphatase